jgi:aryl-alcohol dehydrogenase-like predicted oxidoreductase
MKTRHIGPLTVSALGLGCMNLSHAYGTPPPPEQAERVLLRALELGVTLFDTAALYGFGENEALVGRVLAPHRSRIVLATKGGLHGVEGKRVIDGRPATLRANCDDSLRRLRTDVIDLYYLHRWDKKVPVEDSVGALADLVRAGKVRAIGLSEVSAATLRRAHAVHPVSALQNEYSLWTRNPEIAALAACRELGVSLVAFSPLARSYLTGTLRDVATLDPKDLRRNLPRFQPEAYARNLELMDTVADIARDAGCTPGQLALAWLLAQDDRLVPIPGTTRVDHLEQNLAAADLSLDADVLRRVDAAVNRHAVVGARYPDATLAEIDSEEF